jgi:hypothetical protein
MNSRVNDIREPCGGEARFSWVIDNNRSSIDAQRRGRPVQAWRTDGLSRTKVAADVRDRDLSGLRRHHHINPISARCWAQTLNERTGAKRTAPSQGATSLPFAPKSHNHISESTAITEPMAMQTDKIKFPEDRHAKKIAQGKGEVASGSSSRLAWAWPRLFFPVRAHVYVLFPSPKQAGARRVSQPPAPGAKPGR